MSGKKTITCINCPRGCRMEVEKTESGEIIVTGNSCRRGEQFGKQEMTMPMRTICSTVRTVFPEEPVLPCRVSAEIPKERIFDVMKEINRVTVKERIGRGDVIIPNVCGLGVDVIATSGALQESR